jgi:hypothetical protein
MVATPSDVTAEGEPFQNEDAFWPTAPQDLPSMHVENPKPLLKHKTRASLSEQAGVPARVMATFELQPVGRHEVKVESWFSRMPDTVDAMLAHARLSGLFACYAYAYATFVENRRPCLRQGRHWSPLQIVTDKVPDFSSVRTFGCDVYELVPNDPLRKYPGILKGRKMIFLGYMKGRKGAALFDPIHRKIISGSENIIFHEDMRDRIDALAHFDARREALTKRKKVSDLPVQLSDWTFSEFDPTSHTAVRRLFTRTAEQARHSVRADGEREEDKSAEEKDSAEHAVTSTEPHAQTAKAKARRMEKIIRDSAHMRPVRTVRVGTESKMTAAERRFLNYVERHDIPVVYLQPSPKKGNSGSARRYQRYMMASTIKEAKQLGSSAADVSWDFSRGFISSVTRARRGGTCI